MYKESTGEKLFNFFNIAFLCFASLLVVLPFIYVLASSLTSAEELAQNRYLIFPTKLSFDGYKLLFLASTDMIDGYRITILRVLVGTSLNVTFSYFIAYALAKKDFPLKKYLSIYFFFVILFNGGIVPYYIVVKGVGLHNNFFVYIFPTLVLAYYVLLVRNFIMRIPDSFSESAEIDGASEIVILFKVILPLSIPGMVTVSIFYAVYHWNTWFDAYLFISNSKLYPIQMVLRQILIRASLSYSVDNMAALEQMIKSSPPPRVIQHAAVFSTTLPIMLVYPFLQKYFVKGLTVGGVKG